MNTPLPVLITTREVAERLGVSVRTVEDWRHRGRGPAYITLAPKAVRYDLAVVERYIADNTTRPGSK